MLTMRLKHRDTVCVYSRVLMRVEWESNDLIDRFVGALVSTLVWVQVRMKVRVWIRDQVQIHSQRYKNETSI